MGAGHEIGTIFYSKNNHDRISTKNTTGVDIFNGWEYFMCIPTALEGIVLALLKGFTVHIVQQLYNYYRCACTCAWKLCNLCRSKLSLVI